MTINGESVILFVAGAFLLLLFFRHSLRQHRSHGFHRFFAFVAILVTIVVNVPHWFENPFSPLQLLSWGLLTISLVMAVQGFYLLRRYGKALKPERVTSPRYPSS